MTPQDLDTMARTIWGEARGETFEGKIAVAWVIKNRADNPGWWGHEIAGVCRAPWQFSCWLENDPNRVKLLAVGASDSALKECLAVTAGVLTGIYADPTGGSNHYHTVGISPKWSVGQKPNAKIGAHLFFKL